MTRKIFSFLVLIMIGLQAAAQQKNDIQAPVIRLFDGMSAMDNEAIKAELSTDFTLLENGKVWNTDSLTAAINRGKGMDLKRVNKFEFLKTEEAGNTAWLSYYNTAELEFKGRKIIVRWLESAVLVKEQKKWKIKLLHSTELKPAAAPQKN
jgi:hypothetical protein